MPPGSPLPSAGWPSGLPRQASRSTPPAWPTSPSVPARRRSSSGRCWARLTPTPCWWGDGTASVRWLPSFVLRLGAPRPSRWTSGWSERQTHGSTTLRTAWTSSNAAATVSTASNNRATRGRSAWRDCSTSASTSRGWCCRCRASGRDGSRPASACVVAAVAAFALLAPRGAAPAVPDPAPRPVPVPVAVKPTAHHRVHRSAHHPARRPARVRPVPGRAKPPSPQATPSPAPTSTAQPPAGGGGATLPDPGSVDPLPAP